MNTRPVRTTLLLITLACLAACGTINRMTGEGEAQRIRAGGIAAIATVIDIWDTGMTLNDDPVVGFNLSVQPPDGEPYAAQTKGLVSRLHIPRIQPGAVLPVAIDPADRSRVALAIYEDR